MKFLLLIFKNVRRNLLRTALTGLGIVVLVGVVTMVWSVLAFLDAATSERSQNIKAIVTEKWQIPSRLPIVYAQRLEKFAWRGKEELPFDNMMTWQFYGGTTDPTNRTNDAALFALALEPRKLYTMMDELDSLPPDERAKLKAAADIMERQPNGIVLGPGRLRLLNKQIGDRITVTSFNYRGINLEFEIVGSFPPGRYDLSAAMHRDYLNNALDQWERQNGRPHEMKDKSLNLVWLRFPDTESFTNTANEIVNSPDFKDRPVKCETASSGIATFMESYRDLIWGMKWLFSPAVLVTLSLVIANAISISVRERRMEIAVLKVLGFRPSQILVLVLGEATLLGLVAGALSSWGVYFIINGLYGGLPFPIAFFAKFMISWHALWWGPAIGLGAAFFGSLAPALAARTVKVSDVFAKVA